jgi:membrane-associated protein
VRAARRLLPSGRLPAVRHRPVHRLGQDLAQPLFDRPNSRLFKKKYVDQAHAFFEKYGARAIVLARFVPIVRTFITAIAGVGRMDFGRYALYSGVGAVIWAAGVTILGYYLGNIPIIKNNIEIMLVVVVLLSVIPIVFEVLRHRRRAAG